MRNTAVLPPTYLFAAIVVMGALHFLLPVVKLIRFPWALFGALPFAIGVALNLIADAEFKKRGTTVKPFEESSVLITDGVFRICRHPMYLGSELIVLGLAVLMGTATPFLVVVIFPLLMEVVFIRVEERMLEEKFDRRWRDYKANVRKWL